MIELERDFPTPAAWLHLASDDQPVRVLSWPDRTHLQIQTKVDR